MAWLADFVRGLIIVVFFVHVAQLLLPESGVRDYVRFVMGLLVVAAILVPVLALFNLDYDLQRQLFGSAFFGLETGLGLAEREGASLGNGPAAGPVAEGQALAAAALRRLNEASANRFAQQVASVAALAAGVEPEQVDVSLGSGGEPAAVSAVIRGRRGDGALGGARDGALDPERIRRIVAQFFGLPLEQVEVRITGF